TREYPPAPLRNWSRLHRCYARRRNTRGCRYAGSPTTTATASLGRGLGRGDAVFEHTRPDYQQHWYEHGQRDKPERRIEIIPPIGQLYGTRRHARRSPLEVAIRLQRL